MWIVNISYLHCGLSFLRILVAFFIRIKFWPALTLCLWKHSSILNENQSDLLHNTLQLCLLIYVCKSRNLLTYFNSFPIFISNISHCFVSKSNIYEILASRWTELLLSSCTHTNMYIRIYINISYINLLNDGWG